MLIAKPCWSCVPEKAQHHAGLRVQKMILGLWQQFKDDGLGDSQDKLCHWFEVPRRAACLSPIKAQPKLQELFVTPLKAMIEPLPRYVGALVGH